MSKVDKYREAGTRENTRQSYASAIRHFELEWGGFLPTTADSVSRYLSHYAATHSLNTLKLRLAALSQWHLDYGFPDPTKAPDVRKVLRGIRALHPYREKQAAPMQLEILETVVAWLDAQVAQARQQHHRGAELRHLRNKSLLLLGFWRGFRGDELTRLRVEHVEVTAGEGMSCHFPRTKGDREGVGVTHKAPALSRLCPVDAYLDWISATQITSGPVYRAIDRWGHVASDGLHPDSLVPLLRQILKDAGIGAAELYSGHSLRRGFANWASANGWDLKTLMEYVGWKNVHSAMRYLDAADPFSRRRIERTLSYGAAQERLDK